MKPGPTPQPAPSARMPRASQRSPQTAMATSSLVLETTRWRRERLSRDISLEGRAGHGRARHGKKKKGARRVFEEGQGGQGRGWRTMMGALVAIYGGMPAPSGAPINCAASYGPGRAGLALCFSAPASWASTPRAPLLHCVLLSAGVSHFRGAELWGRWVRGVCK